MWSQWGGGGGGGQVSDLDEIKMCDVRTYSYVGQVFVIWDEYGPLH